MRGRHVAKSSATGFDESFDAFFSGKKEPEDFWESLARRGFADDEVDALRDLLDQAAFAGASAGAAGGLSAVLRGQGELESVAFGRSGFGVCSIP